MNDTSAHTLQLVECPRDAMQGWKTPISTRDKINYIQVLLGCGFHTIDFGSFVSPKAIPQMADTAAVLKGLDLSGTSTALLAIVANLRGAEEAIAFDAIKYLGFPFSVSETFQQRNANSSINEALKRVEAIQSRCIAHNRELVVYLSMGFGNPYGDPWSEEIVFHWAQKLVSLGITTLSVADTVGLARPDQVGLITGHLIGALPATRIGVHLHADPANREAKLEAAFAAGCRRFDGALGGFGGCPMAGNELVGNMDTRAILQFLEKKKCETAVDAVQLEKAAAIAARIFV
ncbi:MAG: hydroxymethylglutaryl-CoA lyase [Flavihumibacter sp.]